jgi:hypothetical protein
VKAAFETGETRKIFFSKIAVISRLFKGKKQTFHR